MYIEFGCGEKLEETPIIYGLVHQVKRYSLMLLLLLLLLFLQLSIYFGAYFICFLGGASWSSKHPLLLGSIAFSGFFTYEICRKLDPTLPRVSRCLVSCTL